MPFNRPRSCVVAGLLLLLLATPGFGQGPQGLQIFAPADVSTYGGGHKPNEGYFFQFDGLYWSIQRPRTSIIGSPGLTREVSYGPHDEDVRVETNTLDTGDFRSGFHVGNRIEFGRVEDRNGWFVSIYQLRSQGDEYNYSQADVVFMDPPQGPAGTRLLQGPVPLNPDEWPEDNTVVLRDLPVTLYNITMSNNIDTWGVELMYLHRALTNHRGGTFEFFAGARYLEFNDDFRFQAGPDPGGHIVPSFLSDSFWASSAENHIVGPQIGLRWFKKQGRWMLSTEGRFLAGLNCQNVRQVINLGPNLDPGGVEGNGETTGSDIYTPSVMAPTSASADVFAREWSPLLELRVEGRYQITRSISFHAGWTGFWVDNIARANDLINYTLPAMGIDMTNNKQNVFVSGLTIGFDINR